jgi:phage shock protein PspC (stress-responsive transcriptional regulator)
MQRIIQITLAARLIPIEEDAYTILKDYITSLERHFSTEEGKYDIIDDIEGRIAELFTIRLNAGAHAVDRTDVLKVIETLGPASALNDGMDAAGNPVSHFPAPYVPPTYNSQYTGSRRLFRNPNDKMIGGVCSGLANYFDIDPVIVRLVFAVLFLTVGVGLLAYILAWVIIPVAKTPQDMSYMSGGAPMDFNTIKRNVGDEMQDMKRRGEQMSRELKDFFNKKK